MSILSYAKKDGKPTIFVGMEKNNSIHINHLVFEESVDLDLDLVLASIVMRHRQITKHVFNTSDLEERRKAAVALEIEGLFKLDTQTNLSCPTKHIGDSLPSNMLVFYLASDSIWKVVGFYDILALQASIPVVELYKRYYALHYPKVVSEYAFTNPKDIKRVYQVDQLDDGEDFLFESLFIESDIVDHVFSPTPQLESAA